MLNICDNLTKKNMWKEAPKNMKILLTFHLWTDVILISKFCDHKTNNSVQSKILEGSPAGWDHHWVPGGVSQVRGGQLWWRWWLQWWWWLWWQWWWWWWGGCWSWLVILRLEEGVWAGGQGCPILDHRFLNFIFCASSSQDLLVALLFWPKSSGNARDEAAAADEGLKLTEEEEERGGRRLHLVLTLIPGPPLIVGSPCTGDKSEVHWSLII